MDAVDMEGRHVWRGCLGLVSGAWLWLLISPIAPLLRTVHQRDLFIIIGILTLAQWQPYRWVRFVCAIVTCPSVLILRFAPHPSHILHSVDWLCQSLWHDGYLGLRGDPATPVLLLAIILVAVSVTCWLVHYVSLRPRLWLFYCALGLVVLGSLNGRHLVLMWQLPAFLCLSLCVLALRRFTELFANSNLSPQMRSLLGFLAPAAGVLIACSGLALLFPKPESASANLLPEAGRYGTGHGWTPSSVQRAGYSLDNAELGGSFAPGHGSVLEVATATPAYLRGAVYTTYTGHGWELPLSPRQAVRVGEEFPTSGAFQHLPTTQVRQTITVLQGLAANVLFGGYSMATLERSTAMRQASTVAVDSQTHAVFTQSSLAIGGSYTVVSDELQDPENVLRTIQTPSVASLPRDVRADLQLPASLPTRVRALARTLAAGKSTEYGQVAAIVNDLRSRYTYQTTNIPRPQPAQDYVDEFLFESRRGYCDNFSSAAAVLLRTLGIPTRWVTGFTEGTSEGPMLPDGSRQYVVSANDAHAWIEVYFPRVGWIPFDATPGFELPIAPTKTDQQQGGGTTAQSNPGTTPTQTPPSARGTNPGQPGVTSTLNGARTPWWRWGADGTAIVVVALGLIWFLRRRVPRWLRWLAARAEFRRACEWWALSRTRSYLRRWLRLPNTAFVMRHGTSDGDGIRMQSSVASLRLQLELRREIKRLIAKLRREGHLPLSRGITLRDLVAAALESGISVQKSADIVRTAEQALYGDIPVDEPTLREAIQTFRTWMNSRQ